MPAEDSDFSPPTVARRNDDVSNRLRRCNTCSKTRRHALLLDRDVSAALAMAFLGLLQLLRSERPVEFDAPPSNSVTEKVKSKALRPARRSARLAAVAAATAAATAASTAASSATHK